jgi:murein DD-endopeptidase MepM/ murein hydrolase activator NlpD
VIPAQRDLAVAEHWEKSLERSRHKRSIIPELRRRQNRRRRTSAALSTLMVAGPASQIFAGITAQGAAAAGSGSPATRAIGQAPTGTFFRVGSTGEAVKAIQARLGLAADGIYGVATERAVRAFQARTGLGADGVVGPVTWTRLMGLGKAAMRAGAGEGDVAVIVRERPTAAPASNHVTRAPARPARRAVAAPGRSSKPRSKSAGAGDTPAPPKRDVVEPKADPAPPAHAHHKARTKPVADPAPAVDPGSGACGELRLSLPVKGVRTSPFGPRGGRNHDGLDIAAPTGTPIHAAECGVVSFSGVQGGYGNMVCVDHSSALQTCYAHMSRTAARNGQTVRKGQVIGYVGTTGHSTGPHVHFETRVNGQARDPEPYLRGGAVPGRPKVLQAAAAARTNRATTTSARVMTASSRGASVKTSGAARAPVVRSAPAARPAPSAAPMQASAPPVSVARPAPAPQPVQAAPVAQPVQPAPVAQPQPAAQVAPAAPSPPAQPEQAAPAAEPEQRAPAAPGPAEPEQAAPAAQAAQPEQAAPATRAAPAAQPAAQPAAVQPAEPTQAAPSRQATSAPPEAPSTNAQAAPSKNVQPVAPDPAPSQG